MATNRNPRFKACRRFGMNIYGHSKALKRQPADARQKKQSEYGAQLAEKQKVKAIYNVLERQFYRYYDKANRMEGVTGANLLFLLETRLDNLVYRAGFARSIRQARQMVNHGLINVDGKRVDIPSYPVRPGQVISLREAYRANDMFKQSFQELKAFDLACRSAKSSPTKTKSTKRTSSNSIPSNWNTDKRKQDTFRYPVFLCSFPSPVPPPCLKKRGTGSMLRGPSRSSARRFRISKSISCPCKGRQLPACAS